MDKKTILPARMTLLATTLCLSLASAHAEGLNYSYIEADYIRGNADSAIGIYTADGGRVAGSWGVFPSVAIEASAQILPYKKDVTVGSTTNKYETKQNRQRLGFVFHAPNEGNTQLELGLTKEWSQEESKLNGTVTGKTAPNATLAMIGVRSRVSERFEVRGRVSAIQTKDGYAGNEYGLDLNWFLNERFALGLGYERTAPKDTPYNTENFLARAYLEF